MILVFVNREYKKCPTAARADVYPVRYPCVPINQLYFVSNHNNEPILIIDTLTSLFFVMAADTKNVPSEEKTASYKETFDLFDKDQNGTISTSELGSIMRAVGHNPTEQDLEDILKEIDKDNSGAVEFDEFVELMGRTFTDQGTADELYQAFSLFDKDGSGNISLSELGQVMENLGEKLSPEELQLMIQEADLDGDNEISFTEFKKMLAELGT